jgi:hypothetical protein
VPIEIQALPLGQAPTAQKLPAFSKGELNNGSLVENLLDPRPVFPICAGLVSKDTPLPAAKSPPELRDPYSTIVASNHSNGFEAAQLRRVRRVVGDKSDAIENGHSP